MHTDCDVAVFVTEIDGHCLSNSIVHKVYLNGLFTGLSWERFLLKHEI